MLGKLVAECLGRGNGVEDDTLDLMQVEAHARSPEIQRRAADFFSTAILIGTARAS